MLLTEIKKAFLKNVVETTYAGRRVFTLSKPLHGFKLMTKPGHGRLLANVIIPEGTKIQTDLFTNKEHTDMELFVFQATRMFIYSVIDPNTGESLKRARSSDDPIYVPSSMESSIPYKAGKVARGENLNFLLQVPETMNAIASARTRRNAGVSRSQAQSSI